MAIKKNIIKIFKYPQTSTNIHFRDMMSIFLPEIYCMEQRILHKEILLQEYRKVYRIIRKYIFPFYSCKLKINFAFVSNKPKKNIKTNSAMLYYIILFLTLLLRTLFIMVNFVFVKCILRKETITVKYHKVPSIYIKNQHLCNDS
jgi:hypothetical protein